MLNDTRTYKEIKTSCDKQILTKIRKLTARHGKDLTDKEIDFLLNFEYKCSNLYGLPKITAKSRTKLMNFGPTT